MRYSDFDKVITISDKSGSIDAGHVAFGLFENAWYEFQNASYYAKWVFEHIEEDDILGIFLKPEDAFEAFSSYVVANDFDNVSLRDFSIPEPALSADLENDINMDMRHQNRVKI